MILLRGHLLVLVRYCTAARPTRLHLSELSLQPSMLQKHIAFYNYQKEMQARSSVHPGQIGSGELFMWRSMPGLKA